MTAIFLFAALAVVGGTLLSTEQFWALLLLLLLAALFFKPHRTYWLLLLLSLSYGQLWLNLELRHRLPLSLDKIEVELPLRVLAVEPRAYGWAVHAQVLAEVESLPPLRRLSLNLYQKNPMPQVASLMQAQLRLRSPRGFANDLPFDYEAWLISKTVDATGTVRSWQPLSSSEPLPWRAALLQQGAQRYGEVWPWLSGLLLGEQDAFTKAQWDLAKRTGTVHVLVVSGMHLTLWLLLGLGLWQIIVRVLQAVWPRNLPYLLLLRSAFLLILAGVYLYLAGMGVALWRAWLMLAVVLLVQQSRWRLPWLTAIALALWLLLLANPLAWRLTGFQYSFAAVAVLLVFFSYRRHSKIEALWRPQLLLFVAMLPLLLYWGQAVSPLQALANLVAIPYVSVVLLPLSLLHLLWPSTLGMTVLAQAGEGFWQWLAWVNARPWPFVHSLPACWYGLWLLWLWLIWRGLPLRVLWPLVSLVVSLPFIQTLPQHSQLRLVDVGQGQSVIFTTPNQTLLYDTGPILGELDTGDAIVRPSLMRLGVNQIDTLVVSHADNDHAGGTQALLQAFRVTDFYANQELGLRREPQSCLTQGSSWRTLDASLSYRFFPLPDVAWHKLKKTSNNRSCVMQVQWYGTRVLLPGDIGAAVEQALVIYYGAELQSQLLVLSHHGSNSSSTAAFLQAVKPQEVWISAGFHNSYGHPDARVLARLQALGIPWYNSGESGALLREPLGITQGVRALWRWPWQVDG